MFQLEIQASMWEVYTLSAGGCGQICIRKDKLLTITYKNKWERHLKH